MSGAEAGQRDLSLKAARVVSLGNGHQLLVLNPPELDPPAQTWASDGQPMLLTPVRGQLFGVGDACEQGGLYAAQPSGDGLKRVLTVDDSADEPRLPAWKVEEPRTPSFPSWWSDALPADVSRRLSVEECHRRASAGFNAEELQRGRYGQGYHRKSCVRLTPKERNRLAQKRFRDRQKALIAGLQCKVEDLSALVRQYQVQTADLQRERLDLVAELRKRGVAWPVRHC